MPSTRASSSGSPSTSATFPPTTYPYQRSINEFVDVWWKVGIIVEKNGPGAGPFPRAMWVQTGRALAPDARLALAANEALVPIDEHPRFRR